MPPAGWLILKSNPHSSSAHQRSRRTAGFVPRPRARSSHPCDRRHSPLFRVTCFVVSHPSHPPIPTPPCPAQPPLGLVYLFCLLPYPNSLSGHPPSDSYVATAYLGRPAG